MIKIDIEIDRFKCCGCGACATVCPENDAMLLCGGGCENWIEIKEEHCKHCGLCAKVCPVGALKFKEDKNKGN